MSLLDFPLPRDENVLNIATVLRLKKLIEFLFFENIDIQLSLIFLLILIRNFATVLNKSWHCQLRFDWLNYLSS